ncbi:unnamed protein product [Prorocentrum cordatum]|uniref:COX assembly mitochondrial protein n=1 Tax=Prorocentrum cordatum TaxID=2364126 RepID=A0ABN9U9C3_9DINO|nr:unnamed protein product [Polarella glacialis]
MERNVAIKKALDDNNFTGLSINNPSVPDEKKLMWSDLVQGKPELEDSLSSNARQMKAEMYTSMFKDSTDLDHPCRIPGSVYLRCVQDNVKANQKNREAKCTPLFGAFDACRKGVLSQQAGAVQAALAKQDIADRRAKARPLVAALVVSARSSSPSPHDEEKDSDDDDGDLLGSGLPGGGDWGGLRGFPSFRRGKKHTDTMNRRFPGKDGKMWEVGGRQKPGKYGKMWGIFSFVCIYLCVLGPLQSHDEEKDSGDDDYLLDSGLSVGGDWGGLRGFPSFRRGTKHTDTINRRFPGKDGKIWEVGGKTKTWKI